MLYSYLVKKLVRQSFDNVNSHNYDELLKAVAPNVHHRFGGAHSIGGERLDKEPKRRWLERVGRDLLKLHIQVNKHLGQRLAVAHRGVCAVGRDGYAAEWRLLVFQPRFPCYYYAVGQSLFTRCVRGFARGGARAGRSGGIRAQ